MSRNLSNLIARMKCSLSPESKDRLKYYRYKVGSAFLDVLESFIGQFITFHTRPIYCNDIRLDDPPALRYSDVAIVMQGPVIVGYYFTLETLRLYRTYYPDVTLILSTWKGEPEGVLERIRSEGVEVLLLDKPRDPGPCNINMQLASTRAGILKAAVLGKRYTMKTRTEARLYDKEALSFFMDLLMQFPLSRSWKQRGRLIGTRSSTFKQYFFSDMLVFGYTEDVRSYFEAPPLPGNTLTLRFNGADIPFVPEQYFFSEFLKRAGRTLTYTDEDSLAAQAEHVLVVDGSVVDWYWYKYDRHHEYRHLSYRRRKRIMGFPEWLSLYRRFAKSVRRE